LPAQKNIDGGKANGRKQHFLNIFNCSGAKNEITKNLVILFMTLNRYFKHTNLPLRIFRILK